MLYLNHAATSWPKPEAVLAAVAEEMAASPEDWAERLAAQEAREEGPPEALSGTGAEACR